MTGLHWACKKGDLEAVKILINYKSDIEALDFVGRTALYIAIAGNFVLIVQWLLYMGAEPWSPEDFVFKDVIKDDVSGCMINYLLKLTRKTRMCICFAKS